jgi:hypothetical protein
MDATAYIQSDVAEMAITMDVYRKEDSGAYSGDFTKVGAADVHVFNPSSQQQVVVEGSGEETSMTGLKLPEYDIDDNLVEPVHVNDQLRVGGKRYDVRVKEGIPNEIDPDLWRLGLDTANTSD